MRALREFDAAAVEDVFCDGLLNVMAAPEFAQSDKLRRVFSALENRATSASSSTAWPAGAASACSSAARTRPPTCSDVALVLAPYGRPGRAVGVVGVLGPRAWPTRRRSAPSASCRG